MEISAQRTDKPEAEHIQPHVVLMKPLKNKLVWNPQCSYSKRQAIYCVNYCPLSAYTEMEDDRGFII